MKIQRHNMIRSLIEAHVIETQEELSERLRAAGFRVTQATVSRDIKEMRLVKTATPDGRYRYSDTSRDVPETEEKQGSRLRNIFIESVVGVDYAQNIVVLKTLQGVAMAAAAAVDAMHVGDIVGSLAGDDTFILIMRDEEKAMRFCMEMRKMITPV